MADQDAQDITQMNTGAPEVPISAGKPRKSYLVWIVLGCVVVGVGLGVFVYQRSLIPTAPSPTPKPVVVTPKPSPIASPVTPAVNVVEAQPKAVAFPKAGKLRVYYQHATWTPLGIVVKDPSGTETFNIASGTPTTAMKILDTDYDLLGPTSVTIDSFLGSNSSQLSIGWASPAANKCGFNGYSVVDISAFVTFATQQAKGEPIVSVQCWGDYAPDPADASSKDFNDYVLIWSYTPSGTGASASPSSSAVASISPSPSASATASASVTPTPSARAALPDTSEGVPVTGVFEVTVGTVSVGLILLVLGLAGLLAL